MWRRTRFPGELQGRGNTFQGCAALQIKIGSRITRVLIMWIVEKRECENARMHACALARATPRSIAPGSFSPSMEVDSEGIDRDLRARGMGACRSDLQDYCIGTLPANQNPTGKPHRTRPRKGEPPEGWLQLAQLVAHYCTYGVCVGSRSRSMYSKL